MSLQFEPLHPTFVAEAGPIDLATAHDEACLAGIRAGLARYAVLVFRGQRLGGDELAAFAERLDGTLQTTKGSSTIARARLTNPALSDISNVDYENRIAAPDDRRRLYSLGNRLWHTDASFQDPPGRYSLLLARVLPAAPPDTQFADTRTAYDRLDSSLKSTLAGLSVHHSIAHSRESLGFTFSAEERRPIAGVVQPLVRSFPETGRKALYIASHASHVIGWPVPEGRLLLLDLMERATRPELVYSHAWRDGDLVIWDNRASMHRAMPFDDLHERREMLRVTTLDLPDSRARIAAGQ